MPVFLSVSQKYHCINYSHIFFSCQSWHIWSPEIALMCVIIAVRAEVGRPGVWVGWVHPERCSSAGPLKKRSGSLLLLQPWWTREWRRDLRLRLTPHMTRAVLTRSCEREITSGLLKLSVKNNSIWRAQCLWLCRHACNGCFKQKKWKSIDLQLRMNPSHVQRPKYWIQACSEHLIAMAWQQNITQ